MQATILNRSLMCSTATAMTVLGLVSAAPLARAAPEPCSQYAFDGDFVVRGANIGEATVYAAPGTRLVGDAMTIADNGHAVRGFASGGGIEGRNIDFTISWVEEKDTVWTFTGSVADDALVHRGIMHGPGFMSLWDSASPLTCNDPDIATKPLPGSAITPPAPATTRVPGPITAP